MGGCVLDCGHGWRDRLAGWFGGWLVPAVMVALVCVGVAAVFVLPHVLFVWALWELVDGFVQAVFDVGVETGRSGQ